MKPIYQWGWESEGKFFRKKNWTIKSQTWKNNIINYMLRRVDSKPGKFEPGEMDFNTLKEAMKAGNANIRQKLGK